METERRRQIVLAILAVVLVVVVYRAWRTTSPAPGRSSNQKTSGTSGASAGAAERGSAAAVAATDVHLEALEAERPKPGTSGRNLFRFREKRPPPPPPPPTPDAGLPRPEPPKPVDTTPQLPPINLKFLGTVKGQAEGRPKIAILSDGNGPPLYGKEGELVAGRYRILKIGEESIELAYADGRGRQTIRLTGS